MKRYRIITIIMAMLFCLNAYSQEITLPNVTILSTPDIDVDCRGGIFDVPVQIPTIVAKNIDVFINNLNLQLSAYEIRVISITSGTEKKMTLCIDDTEEDIAINVKLNGGWNGGSVTIIKEACNWYEDTDITIAGNWIMKNTYLAATNASQYYQDITFFDGLGFAEQIIQVKGSPAQKNIVKPVYYDNMRRDNAKVYLPYVSTKNTAARENSPFTAQTAFYKNKFGQQDGQYAYIENVFEPSPLNRILQTYNVGAVYRTEDRKSVNSYSTNGTGEVFLMNVNPSNGNVTITGWYAPNTLYKNYSTNEDGATVYTYTNKFGQTILTRAKDDNGQNLDTYYVYDDYGQQVMVISPEYSSIVGTGTTLTPGSSMVARYCYTYKYDGRKNMVERQMPGKEAEYMIYDKDGRPVMSQDGNMRANNRWIYSVYDNVGNLTDKTLVKTTLTRQQIQEKYYATNFHNNYSSLGESNCIYTPFKGSGEFTTEYLVQSERYYGKSYYVRNDIEAGTYLRVNTSLIPITFGEITIPVKTANEATSSIDINGEILEKAKPPAIPLNPGDDDLPPDNPPGGGSGGGGSGGGSGSGGSGGGGSGGGGYVPIVPDPPLKPDSVCDPDHLYINSAHHVKDTYLYYTDSNNPNMKYYTISAQYMSIAQCLASNFSAYDIFTGIPGGVQTAEWKKNPSYLDFEPVAGVCTLADLDSVKIKHLKAYETVKILKNDGDFVERTFYYDKRGRVIQTVEKNHLRGISRYSTKYDFVGNVLAQHEKHETFAPEQGSSNNAIKHLQISEYNEKSTIFTYDQRGRLLREATTINDSVTAKVEYKYNELGQQIAKIYDNSLVTDSTKYNIQGWIIEKNAKNADNDNVFDMKLSYYNPTKPNTAPSYTGNITEWTWRHEDLTQNTYSFTYDKLSRLTNSLMYINNVQANSFTEQGFTYDKNGNIKTLKRYGEADTIIIDDLTYGYNGNQLTSLTGTTTATYAYDANGNMNIDYRKNLDMEYNLLNLPYQIKQNDTVKASYSYIADGTKAGATDSAGNGFDYLGSLVYTNNNGNRALESTGFGGGRINKTNNSYDINYFITDHLGSTRAIVDNAGNIKEQKDYYPFGKEHENANLMSSTNRWGYNGKEKQIVGNLNYLDYINRMYDPEIGRWFVQDPLQEKFYSWSSYAYCFNNPIRFIDPFGLDSLDAVALKQAAENAVKYVTDNYGTTQAYCNQGVNHAFEELTGNKELSGKNANNMVKQLESSDNFVTVSQNEVQTAANDGEIVIAGKQATSGSGHVALAVPGEKEASTSWGGSAPVGMDTGKDKRWSKNGMNHSWTTNEGVKFYKYTGERNGTTDNKTYYGGTISATIVAAPAKVVNRPLNANVILNTNINTHIRK